MKIKSYAQISNEIISQLESELNISSPPGGVVRILSNVVGGEISKLYIYLNQLINNLYIGEAGGELLDALGAIFGLTRRPASFFDTITGVRFHVNSGTLGDVIATDFFQSNDVRVKDNKNEFKVIPISLSAEDLAKQYVDVNCEAISVSDGIAERNTIVNFTPATQGLYVTNPSDIKLYASQESDEQFRYRISRHLSINRIANGRQYRLSNRASLRIAALDVPGIADVFIKEYTNGGGSFTLYVVGEDLNNDSLLPSNVSAAISDIVPYGTRYDVVLPIKTKIYIELNGDYSSTSELTEAVENHIRDYVDDIRIGGQLSLDNLKREISITAAPYGTTNKIKVYVAQDDSLGVEHRGLLTYNYQCFDREKLMLAPTSAVVI